VTGGSVQQLENDLKVTAVLWRTFCWRYYYYRSNSYIPSNHDITTDSIFQGSSFFEMPSLLQIMPKKGAKSSSKKGVSSTAKKVSCPKEATKAKINTTNTKPKIKSKRPQGDKAKEVSKAKKRKGSTKKVPQTPAKRTKRTAPMKKPSKPADAFTRFFLSCIP